MVTPIWLNGAGCATAVPAVSVKAINSVTNTFVFTDASLLISSCLAMRERYQPAVKMSRAFGCKKGEDDGSGRLANGAERFRQMLASKCGNRRSKKRQSWARVKRIGAVACRGVVLRST